MKKLPFIIILLAVIAVACAKGEESTWDKYKDWREVNNNWLAEQLSRTNPDGTPYFQKIVPDWNPGAFVLIHYFNDRAETEGKLSPIYTSTVDVRYMLHLYNDTPVDSSSNLTQNGPGIFRCRLNEMIQGWAMAIPDMRCGDTAEIIVPYGVAYGAQTQSGMNPYSNLRFNVRLVNIAHLESSPY